MIYAKTRRSVDPAVVVASVMPGTGMGCARLQGWIRPR